VGSKIWQVKGIWLCFFQKSAGTKLKE